jgi:hypothetical protein
MISCVFLSQRFFRVAYDHRSVKTVHAPKKGITKNVIPLAQGDNPVLLPVLENMETRLKANPWNVSGPEVVVSLLQHG